MGIATGRERIRVGVTRPPDGATDPTPSAARAALRASLAGHAEPTTSPQLDRLCAALGAAIDAEITAHNLRDYRHLLDAMHAGEVDLAWLPPVVALQATARGRTVPVAVPVRDGMAYYATALFTRKDSYIQGLSDLPGTHAAWVDRHSAAGYLVIRASLRTRGIDVDRAFSNEAFYGSHDAVVQAVLEGLADVGASYVILDPRRSKPRRAAWGDAPVRMLATAGPIPNDIVAASIRLPVLTIRRVQRALMAPPTQALRQACSDFFMAQGFVEVSSEHLEPLRTLLGYTGDRSDFPSIV